MKLIKKAYQENDFLRIRDFLKRTYHEEDRHHNWLIDRWNFTRYVGQVMHNTVEVWPATVGIFENAEGSILAVVNSEGEVVNRDAGHAFFQFENIDFSDENLLSMIKHAETHFPIVKDGISKLYMHIGPDQLRFKALITELGYKQTGYKEFLSMIEIDDRHEVELPEVYKIVDSTIFTDGMKGFAHGKAFGYYKGDTPDDDDSMLAFRSLRNAPDYDETLDLAVLDPNGEIAAFAGFWYDDQNQIGILEPLGTVPKHRKLGLAKALIYEGMNRLLKKGAHKLYVGSNQEAYKKIGFKELYYQEIWLKEEVIQSK
ncbi:hypothetical protein BK011_02635 [Tenericutes bacterium MZ-XQ]|nr:hypothetical protein BK011_02635 [Tenericutes bacterium MZ-XQ]